MTIIKRVRWAVLAIAVAMTGISCFMSKPVPYFKGEADERIMQEVVIPEQLIQKGDILSITVYSDNPQATTIFNQAGGVSVSGSGTTMANMPGRMANMPTGTAAAGYLVDGEGCIRMHAIGRVKVEGLTRAQAQELISGKLAAQDLLKNPYCVVRNTNFKITVLGEVANPGVFIVPSEKASVLDALGLAGDFTNYGRKDKVMLVREESGKRTFFNLDLTDSKMFSSPNFYLRQNDVLIVRADDKKPTASDQQTMQLVTLMLTVVTALTLLLNTIGL
jgi:polysaccharide export outer membrane protein